MKSNLSRRDVIKTLGASAATIPTILTANEAMAQEPMKLKGNIKHSVSRWCYNSIPFEELCQASKDMGIASIELTGPKEWAIMKNYGLTSAMGWADPWPEKTGLTSFLNNPKNHDAIVKCYEELLPQAQQYGITNVICFSGNRNGLGDYQGLLNCQKGIKRLMPLAEKYGVTLTMELLSSRASHPDYQCDNLEWGAVLCEMVGSEKFKMLYDIYHMQSMSGDHIRNIQRYGKYISHYHTGGHPGRNEIDETQEIYYPAIMRAIVDSGYKGYVGQEFVPKAKDKEGMLASLKKCVLICDV